MFDIREIDNLAPRRRDVFKANWTRPNGFTSKQWYLYNEIDAAKDLFSAFPREFSHRMKAALFPLSLDADQLVRQTDAIAVFDDYREMPDMARFADFLLLAVVNEQDGRHLSTGKVMRLLDALFNREADYALLLVFYVDGDIPAEVLDTVRVLSSAGALCAYDATETLGNCVFAPGDFEVGIRNGGFPAPRYIGDITDDLARDYALNEFNTNMQIAGKRLMDEVEQATGNMPASWPYRKGYTAFAWPFIEHELSRNEKREFSRVDRRLSAIWGWRQRIGRAQELVSIEHLLSHPVYIETAKELGKLTDLVSIWNYALAQCSYGEMRPALEGVYMPKHIVRILKQELGVDYLISNWRDGVPLETLVGEEFST